MRTYNGARAFFATSRAGPEPLVLISPRRLHAVQSEKPHVPVRNVFKHGQGSPTAFTLSSAWMSLLTSAQPCNLPDGGGGGGCGGGS